MRLGLQARVSLGIIIGAVALTLTLSSVTLYRYNAVIDEIAEENARQAERALTERTRIKALMVSQLAAESMVNHMYYGHINIIADFAISAKTHSDVQYVLVLTPDGKVVHDGTEQLSRFGEIVQDDKTADVIASRQSKTWIADGKIHAMSPMLLGNEIVGLFRVGLDLSTVAQDQDILRNLLLEQGEVGRTEIALQTIVIAVFVTALAMAFGILLARGPISEIQLLKNAAARIGQGDYRAAPVLARQDEIGDLANAIRLMADNLQNSDRKMRKALLAAEHANEAKSAFLSSMSHELRTPLNAVLGYAQLMKGSLKEPLTEKQSKGIRRILDSGEHLLNLIDQILFLSKIEEGNFPVNIGPVQIGSVIDKSIELATASKPESISLIVNKNPNKHLFANTDSVRLTQILVNFLTNAIKYNRDDGEIEISSNVLANGFVRISIKDNGLGIPHGQQDKVFEAFERLGRETGPVEGTGIGLTITKEVSQIIGCHVGFKSVENQGSTFWVDVPLKQIDRAA